jgi:ATP-dependent helicase/DNAse subunit B
LPSLLITGPPDSSTLQLVVDRLKDERLQAQPNSPVLVPTATLADHLRHQLVRAGYAVRPRSIQTISRYLDEHSPFAAAPPALIHLLMERALERQRPQRFREVAEFPGVIRSLVNLFLGNDAPASRMPDDIVRLFNDVERELSSRGMAPHRVRLAALGETENIEVHLEPEAPLRIVRTTNMEREAEEIAARVLSEAALGRPFNEMGIILRSRDPYGPLIETTLARFGIPYRSYFIEPLATHAHIQFLSTVCRAALSGWDREILLKALRMPASGLGGTKAGDDLDFKMREQLPANGWHETAGLNTRDRVDANEWAKHLTALKNWAPQLNVTDHASRDQIHAWRSIAAAQRGWDECVEATREALEDAGRIPLVTFWKQLELTLALEPLRVPDMRRNVVHVLDAHEAKQWSLPIVFVPGMVERHFPQYHRENPIIPGLKAEEDHERDERFLFDVAISRATEETILSFPRFDENGQDSLPSFFLQGLDLEDVDRRIHVHPSYEAAMPSASSLTDQVTCDKLSASSVEDYLQCPFKFFARKTLKLEERPPAPRDRLNVLLQGSIMHAALAAWSELPILGEAALDEAFDQHCAKEHVPRTYRTEAVRLELLRHFRAFMRAGQIALPGWSSRPEEQFEFALNPSLSLRGRIDRLDVDARKNALVIDYKYSAGARMKERIEAVEAGEAVQAGIYLLAAERHFKLRPAGMLYCHLKKGVAWDGWHSGISGLEYGENRTKEAFAELAQNAQTTVLRVHEEILSGRVAVAPTDRDKCIFCDCIDMCRVETLVQVKEAAHEAVS